MQCSATTLVLTLLSMSGSIMYIACGYMALEQTLALFKEYGPLKDRGNPALDPPPVYIYNAQTGIYGPMNYNQRGNLVPQVFAGIQYYLIALGVFMLINCTVFMVDSVRSKKAVKDRTYQGKRTGLSRISCTGWLASYSAFLALMWFVMACFGVIPLLEFRITMQRCWDLANPNWSPGTAQRICIDLVQYGLVFFKETQDTGYGLICGPSNNLLYPDGNLEGFCANYYPVFTLYVVSFAGAAITMMSMILFALRHASNFVYLKVRRWENPLGPPGGKKAPKGPHPHGYDDRPYTNNSLQNPNYEHNVLLVDPERMPDDISLNPYSLQPGDDVMDMKQRYFDRADGDHRAYDKRRSSRSSSSYADEKPLTYDSKRRSRRRSHDSRETPRRRRSDVSDESYDHGSRHPTSRSHRGSKSRDLSTASENGDVMKGTGSSDEYERSSAPYRPKPLRRKAKGAKSNPEIYKQSSRRRKRSSHRRDEYESPPSDYYLQEDLKRRSSTINDRSRSVV
ncbi:uncharacterized protein LOC100184627 [Ciona intestinalis]